MILEECGRLKGYQLIDSGEGMRLERFGDFVLARPDPGALWQRSLAESEWKKADAEFRRGIEDKGEWNTRGKVPERWVMEYGDIKGAAKNIKNAKGDAKGDANSDIKFYAKLTPFKHTGVFPEQAANWDFIREHLKKDDRVLNLFGYTGIPSVLGAKLGAHVTHVDASKPSIGWAQENMKLSGLPENAIRWILDDALKFVKREVRRGTKYEAIIMDPPAFGRGAKGEVWKFHEQFPELLHEAAKLINPTTFNFVIINAYAVSLPALMLKNMLEDFSVEAKLPAGRVIDYGELILEQEKNPNQKTRKLSTGIFGRLYK
jgi:23S rRNA (cytosine1962-C5)-methyltransferase